VGIELLEECKSVFVSREIGELDEDSILHVAFN